MQKQAMFPEQKSSEDTSGNSMQNNLPAFVFIKSNLKLVVDLQNCVKAQQSSAYARKVKLSNLQQMAKTVAYIQEHGYNTEEDLEKASEEAKTQTANMRKALRSTEDKLRQVNEQIHYTGQYLANKSIYRRLSTARIKQSSDKNIRRKSPYMKQHGRY